MYNVVLLPEAEKFYKELFYSDRSHFTRIAEALKSLEKTPSLGKPLRHNLKGKFSLRVGFYCIIYAVSRKEITVYVFNIGHRRDVYQ